MDRFDNRIIFSRQEYEFIHTINSLDLKYSATEIDLTPRVAWETRDKKNDSHDS